MTHHFDFLFNNPYGIQYAYDKDGMAWFVAKQIANYLGYSRARDMSRMCASQEIINMTVDNPIASDIGLNMSKCINLEDAHYVPSSHGGARRFIAISEKGVYDIAMRSRSNRPEIEAFRVWITNLLRSVRQYDAYIGPEAAAVFQLILIILIRFWLKMKNFAIRYHCSHCTIL